jgi:hypothetical protein
VAVGGALNDLSEVYRDHWRDMFYGLSRGDLWVTDERVDIGLEDPIAQILDTEIPTKRYTLAEFPNMDLNREGYSQPIVLGNFIQSGIVTKDAVFMNRIDLTAAGYGVYHLADTTNAPDGLSANTPSSTSTSRATPTSSTAIRSGSSRAALITRGTGRRGA